MSLNIPHYFLLSSLIFLLLFQVLRNLERVQGKHTQVVRSCVQILLQVRFAVIENCHDCLLLLVLLIHRSYLLQLLLFLFLKLLLNNLG